MGISVDATNGNTYNWNFDASTGGYKYSADPGSEEYGPQDTGASEGGQWAYDQGVAGRFDEANALAKDAAYADDIRPISFKATLPMHRPPQPPQPRNIPQKYWRNPGIDITPEQRQSLQKDWLSKKEAEKEIYDSSISSDPPVWLGLPTHVPGTLDKGWTPPPNIFPGGPNPRGGFPSFPLPPPTPPDPRYHIDPDDFLRDKFSDYPGYSGFTYEGLGKGMVDRVEETYKIDEKTDALFKNFSTEEITKAWYAQHGADPNADINTSYVSIADLEAQGLFEDARNVARGESGGRKGPESSSEEIDAMALRSVVRDMIQDLSGIGSLIRYGLPTTNI